MNSLMFVAECPTGGQQIGDYNYPQTARPFITETSTRTYVNLHDPIPCHGVLKVYIFLL